MNDLISVIVPVYKVEQYLETCVESIINQTYTNLEIILVDDGSPDSCGKICDEYAKKDSRIKVIHKENGGLSDARNAGIDVAKGEFWGFVDSDDWIEKDMYELLYKAAKKHSAKLCCGGRYDVFGDVKKPGLCFRKEGCIDSEKMLIKIFKQKECDVSVCDKLFHKSLAEKLKFPIGEINEDAQIICKVISAAEKIALINAPTYNYRHRENSITTGKASEKNLVALKNTSNMVKHCEEYYPKIVKYAKQYQAKKILELCIRVKNMKISSVEEENLKKRLINEMRSKKWQLSFVDRMRYIVLLSGAYNTVRKILKRKH